MCTKNLLQVGNGKEATTKKKTTNNNKKSQTPYIPHCMLQLTYLPPGKECNA